MRYAPGLCAAFFIALCAASTAAATALLITDARVYPAPGVAPIENGAGLVRDDRIVAVGPAAETGAGDTTAGSSAERRGGQECVRPCRDRGAHMPSKKN